MKAKSKIKKKRKKSYNNKAQRTIMIRMENHIIFEFNKNEIQFLFFGRTFDTVHLIKRKINNGLWMVVKKSEIHQVHA